MKNLSMLTLAAFVVLSLFACETVEDYNTKIDQEISQRAVRTHTISKAQFDEWRKRWENNFVEYAASNEIDYFTVSLQSIQEITSQGKLDNIRFYTGMDETIIPHLMLVGTVDGEPNFNIITDLTTVCPPKCY